MLKLPRVPVVVAIYVAPPAIGGPMPVGGHSVINRPVPVQQAKVVKGMGIVGDRWFGVNALLRKDGIMVPHDHARNITFFEEEKFREVQELGFEIEPEDIRRSVMVRNFPLNDLVGKEFSIGSVRFRGSRLSHGCDRIEKMTKIEGLNQALYMRGGLRAAVLTDGTINVGDEISFEKKTVLVTGATSFLGKDTVSKLSERFHVLKTGTKIMNDPDYFQADLTKPEQAKQMVEWALQKSKIDCLICCAGGNKLYSKIDDSYSMEHSDVIDLFGRNVMSAMNCCRYIVPHMVENKSGHIVFIGSDLVGKPQPNGFLTVYTISKPALHEYTGHLANQLAGTGVCVNCVSPCGIAGSSNNGKSMDVSVSDVVNKIDEFCVSNMTGQVCRVLKSV